MSDDQDTKKQEILSFLQSRQYCVLSTVGNDYQPQSALLQYLTKDFELIMNTFHFSRKVANLAQHQSVSVVIGFGDKKKTLQYEGIAEILVGEAREHASHDYHSLYPKGWGSELDGLVEWIHIRPRWLRFVDLSGDALEELILEF